jgi:ornithine cyclodeaminase/alanine dehydrogenase-like protein (mu-crystallin family)
MIIRRPPDVLTITRRDIVRVMAPADFLGAADQAFRAAATGKAGSPPPMHLPMARGGFHAKGASISLERDYVAVKLNGNFPGNPAELGLPTIQGAILLAHGSNGVLLAILDSIEVTLRRTAAASALAAQLLARPDSHSLLVCGCGAQGRAHVTALRDVLPLERFLLWDRDHAAAETLADELARETQTNVTAVGDLEAASTEADVIATCTTARDPFIDVGLVKPGTFIAAVGADNPDKNEIAPRLMAASTVVTDVLDQCAAMGDLHHAVAAGQMAEADVHAELGDVLTGAGVGRSSPEEIIIFDSTGSGFQDVAAAAAIYERCIDRGFGQTIALAAA